MVPFIKMAQWSKEFEEEVVLLIKDWLKHHNKTQKDLRYGLNASSERMPILLEILKKDYSHGGVQKLAKRLSEIEDCWVSNNELETTNVIDRDPFGQLDLLLEEINDDCSK